MGLSLEVQERLEDSFIEPPVAFVEYVLERGKYDEEDDTPLQEWMFRRIIERKFEAEKENDRSEDDEMLAERASGAELGANDGDEDESEDEAVGIFSAMRRRRIARDDTDDEDDPCDSAATLLNDSVSTVMFIDPNVTGNPITVVCIDLDPEKQ